MSAPNFTQFTHNGKIPYPTKTHRPGKKWTSFSNLVYTFLFPLSLSFFARIILRKNANWIFMQGQLSGNMWDWSWVITLQFFQSFINHLSFLLYALWLLWRFLLLKRTHESNDRCRGDFQYCGKHSLVLWMCADVFKHSLVLCICVLTCSSSQTVAVSWRGHPPS